MNLNYSKYSNSGQKYYFRPAMRLNMCKIITHYLNSKMFINLNKKSTWTKVLNSHVLSHLTLGNIISYVLITCTDKFCTVSSYYLKIMANVYYSCAIIQLPDHCVSPSTQSKTDNSVLLGCDTISFGESFSTFRTVTVPSASKVKQSMTRLLNPES
jgi:hypothetical protein